MAIHREPMLQVGNSRSLLGEPFVRYWRLRDDLRVFYLTAMATIADRWIVEPIRLRCAQSRHHQIQLGLIHRTIVVLWFAVLVVIEENRCNVAYVFIV